MINKVTILVPPLLSQKKDLFGSGIPYFPITAAYLAGYLISKGYSVTGIDAFGAAPEKYTSFSEHYQTQGLNVDDIIQSLSQEKEFICIFCNIVINHSIILDLICKVKKKFADLKKIIVFENSQAVTGYSVFAVKKDFFDAGSDFIVSGDPEFRIEKIIQNFSSGNFSGIDGIIYLAKENGDIIENPQTSYIENLDTLPIPANDIFPIQNYWKLKYAHGPYSGKYMPMLTTRGCPYNCGFCVIPSTNSRKFRHLSNDRILKELIFWKNKYGVTDFHFEDVNPTVDKLRVRGLCEKIINEKLNITWKLVSGTKVETFDAETLKLMRAAGCVYISISPESGSPEIMKSIGKPFDIEHAVMMLGVMNKLGIFSQVCFVLGFPGETETDIRLTEKMAAACARAGADEIAVFIITPIPGSSTYFSNNKNFISGYDSLEQLTFSPLWRSDYKLLSSKRLKIALNFNIIRFTRHPLKTLAGFIRMITGNYKTKTEQLLRKILK